MPNQRGDGGMKADYASVWLRWALFLQDHPNAPQPVYGMATAADLNVDDAFKGTGLFVTCAVDPADGTPPRTDWKEVPANEKGKSASFIKTPESLRKLRAGALGRVLKGLGYCETTGDIKVLILWKRRHAEIAALAAGRAIPGELPANEREDAALADAAVPSADHEYEDQERGDSDNDGGDRPAATVDPDRVPWHPDLLPLAAALNGDALDEVLAFARDRGIDTEQPGRDRVVLEAFIKSKLSTPPAAAGDPTEPAADTTPTPPAPAPTPATPPSAPERPAAKPAKPGPAPPPGTPELADYIVGLVERLTDDVRARCETEAHQRSLPWPPEPGVTTEHDLHALEQLIESHLG